MRRSIRTKLLATFMVAVAALTFAGCKANEPTHEFSEPVMSSSYSTGSPEIIDNQGRFQYKLDEKEYSKLLEAGKPTGKGTLTGHAVYEDGSGVQFIISGFTRVDLENGKIPESAWATLREEESGNRIFVQDGATEEAQEQMVTNWVTGWQAGVATLNAAKNESYSGKIIVVNNHILDTRSGNVNVHFDDGVAYIPATTMFAQAGNITMIESVGSGLTFNIQSYQTGNMERYTVDLNNPEIILSDDGTRSLSGDKALVYEVEGVIYIDPVALAGVFDWDVKDYGDILQNKKGVLSIITDQTYADGHAVSASGCIIADDNAAASSNGSSGELTEAQKKEMEDQLNKELEELNKEDESKPELEKETTEEEALKAQEKFDQEEKERQEREDQLNKEAEENPGSVSTPSKPSGGSGISGGGQSSSSSQVGTPTPPPSGQGGGSQPSGGNSGGMTQAEKDILDAWKSQAGGGSRDAEDYVEVDW